MRVTNEQLELLTAKDAAKLTGICRRSIANAMTTWELTKGRQGLRYVQPNESRRLVRKSALLEWFHQMERMSAYGR